MLTFDNNLNSISSPPLTFTNNNIRMFDIIVRNIIAFVKKVTPTGIKPESIKSHFKITQFNYNQQWGY